MFNQENINQLMQEHLNSEDIKEYINEKIKKVVKENIDEQFKSYGDNNHVFKAIQNPLGICLTQNNRQTFRLLSASIFKT